MKDRVLNEIALSREVISSLPLKTIKNKEKFLKQIDEEIKIYQNKLEIIYKELLSKVSSYLSLKENVYDYDKAILQLSKALNYTNNLCTPYEKLKIDKRIYSLERYKDNLLCDNNKLIQSLINLFHVVGINLKEDDFIYSPFSHEYMVSFFKGEDLDEVFEQLYWKDPYIILEVELNFRYLYFKYEKSFLTYIKNINNEMLSNFEEGQKNIIDDYSYLRKKINEVKLNDKNNLICDFVSGKLDISDYLDDKINPLVSKYFSGVSENDVFDLALKLYYCLDEYQNYKKYESIITKIKELYKENLDKKVFDNYLKQVQKLEKDLFKLNKKVKRSNSKTKVDKTSPLIFEIIKQIHEVYIQIDKMMFGYVLKNNLDDNSTLFKALLLTSGYYSFMADIFLKENSDLTYDDISLMIDDFYAFVLNPNNTMINNMIIYSDDDILELLISNYRLLGVNLDNNLDVLTLSEEIKRIIIYYDMKKLNISADDLVCVKKIQKIMESHIQFVVQL